ncbi:hypothetical protein ABIF73_000836 [Bradyrhizobium japonicum]|uniref:hypothetical protein n=1 Tax=Bradyrhizobium japonicum TaxID=375 RepID=UPI00339ACC87
MKNTLIAIMAVAILVLGALVGVLLEDPQTATVEIDRDRAAVSAEINAAKELATRYSGGLIVGLINVRIAILETTDAMLGQKRTALLRRINLTYRAPFDAARPASDAELDDILKELSQAQTRAAESRKVVERYSGGLVQGLAVMKAETDEIAVSELRLKFYSAKHGFPILPTISVDKQNATPLPPGKVVGDKEAL